LERGERGDEAGRFKNGNHIVVHQKLKSLKIVRIITFHKEL